MSETTVSGSCVVVPTRLPTRNGIVPTTPSEGLVIVV